SPHANRATDTGHAPAGPGASAAGSRSTPARRPGAAPLGHGDSRWPAWWLSTRNREEEHVTSVLCSAGRARRTPRPAGSCRPGLARRRRPRLGLAAPEAALVERLPLAQHVVDGTGQPGGQDAQDLGGGVLLLLPLLPLPGSLAATQGQAGGLGESPAQM